MTLSRTLVLLHRRPSTCRVLLQIRSLIVLQLKTYATTRSDTGRVVNGCASVKLHQVFEKLVFINCAKFLVAARLFSCDEGSVAVLRPLTAVTSSS